MSKSWEWSCRIQTSSICTKNALPNEDAIEHPLKPNVVVVCETKGATRRGGSTATLNPTPVMLDPLGAALDGSDPLSLMAAQSWDAEWDKDDKKSKKTEQRCHMEPWTIRRAAILSKFTTTEKLSMVSSFLSGGDKLVVRTQSTAVRTRLEQLDDFEESSVHEVGDLSQQEYVSRIQQLNHELVDAWNCDQRVKALKIAIQCSKLLVDTCVIQFYPSKFVLITDILDIFGHLVYDRLIQKSESSIRQGTLSSSLPENFGPELVPESAKETCRNWFYKIASIRELVPRLYVEAAILKCYSFLDKGELSQALLRLTRMVRGIGDPLVAVYARCYLCRVGNTVPNIEKQLLKENFYDFLNSYHQLFGSTVRSDLLTQRVELRTYLTLYTPALDWIVQSLACEAEETLLTDILTRCKSQTNSSLLLNSIISAFKPAFIASRATYFLQLIANCSDQGFPQHLLYRSMGLCLSVGSADDPHHVWTHVWRYLVSLRDPQHYMTCAEVWLLFTAQHFSSEEVNMFLQDIIHHLTEDRAYERFYPQLKSMATQLVSSSADLESLLVMDKFMLFLDMIRNEGVKVEVCKYIMTEFAAKSRPVNDPVVMDALMSICKVMHDSLNAKIVPDDEKRQIGQLIGQLVMRVDHGRDFEQQLFFYVDARAAFSNLDYVHMVLVQCVNRLAMETGRVVKGHHTRKTSAFVRACAAYCYITIPSILSVTARLQLYLVSAQVALANQCLGQADACLKDALSLVPEIPPQLDVDGKLKSSEPFLVGFLCQTLSTLLVVPDSPEQGVLYLTRGLLNVLQHYTWDTSRLALGQVYLSALHMLSTAAQEQYPYHVPKVDSNDLLYGSDPKFIAEINKMCSSIVEEILSQLKLLAAPETNQQQAVLAMDLCMTILLRADLSSPGLATLAVNLWNLANKNNQIDMKKLRRTVEYLKRRGNRIPDPLYAELVSKLGIS